MRAYTKKKDKQQNRKSEDLTILGEYSYFISKVKEYKSSSPEDSIKKAMKYCIEHGVLKDFLLKNETEVVTMLLGVYDEEIEKQVIREETAERVRKEERAKAAKERAKAEAKAIIDMALDFGYSNEEILSTLQKKLEIKEKQADEYLRKFYDKTF